MSISISGRIDQNLCPDQNVVSVHSAVDKCFIDLKVMGIKEKIFCLAYFQNITLEYAYDERTV